MAGTSGTEVWVDHPGHRVPALLAAASRLESLGFFLTPESAQFRAGENGERIHLGTANRCITLQNSYVEITGPVSGGTSGTDAATIPSKPSLHLVAIGTSDIDSQFARFSESGETPVKSMVMEREIQTIDGKEPGRFELILPEYQIMPATRLLMVRHATPHLIWQERWLTHPNGAAVLSEILFVSADLASDSASLEHFTDHKPVVAPDRVSFDLARNGVTLIYAKATNKYLGMEINRPGLFGYVVRIASIGALTELFSEAGIKPLRTGAQWLSLNELESLGAILFFAEDAAKLPWHSA